MAAQPSDAEPSQLNEVTNELPSPLTAEQRRELGFDPAPLLTTWGGADWGAPTGGGWGDEEPAPAVPPSGAISLVRRAHAAGNRIQDVAIRLAGADVALIDYQFHAEIMIPFPGSVHEASTWPGMPGLHVSTHTLSDAAVEHLRALQQIFAWFSHPHSLEQAHDLQLLWSTLLDRVLAETAPVTFDPVHALQRFLEHAHAILPKNSYRRMCGASRTLGARGLESGVIERCTKCDTGVITVPRLCEGSNNEEHRGWWMESCSNFIGPVITQCNHFKWRPDIPKGPLPKTPKGSVPCPGVLCRALSKPLGINRTCYYGLCQNCCIHAHLTTPSLRSCRVSTHRPTPADQARLASTATPPVGPSIQPPNIAHSIPHPSTHSSAPVSAPTVTAPAATSGSHRAALSATSPAASATLRLLEEQQLQRVADSAIQQSDAADADKTIFVHWWPENDQPSKLYEIVAPYYPKWHPKDSSVLVKLYHIDTEMFEWWDGTRWTWITSSPTTARRDIGFSRKTGHPHATELHYRTLGVVKAEGMPNRAVRRREDSPPELHASPQGSPTKRLRSITPSQCGSGRSTPVLPSRPMTPSDDLGAISDGGSEYDFPPSSDGGSSRYPSRGASVAPDTPAESRAFWLSPTKEYAYAPSTPSSRRSSQAVSQLLTQLDAILPSLPSALVLDDSTELDPTAPRGSSRSGWPLRYVCDMAIGFHAVRRRINSGMPRAVAFEEVFNCKYNSSTWSDNSRAFEAASAVDGEIDRWTSHGRQLGGEWSKFMARWRPARKSPYYHVWFWLDVLMSAMFLRISNCSEDISPGAPTLRDNLISVGSIPSSHRPFSVQHSMSSSSRPKRMALKQLDIEHLALQELTAILRAWAAGNDKKAKAVNLIKDIHRARSAIIREAVTVGWKLVEDFLNAHEIPSKAPPKGSKRNWATDVYIAQLVRHGRMPLPGIAAPASNPRCLEMVAWRPYIGEAVDMSAHTQLQAGINFRPSSDHPIEHDDRLYAARSHPAKERQVPPEEPVSQTQRERIDAMAAHGIPTTRSGHVAAVGYDRRHCTPNQPSGQPILSILSLMPLSYHLNTGMVTAPVEEVVNALIDNALGLDRNIYISIPERVGGEEFLTRVAIIDEQRNRRILASGRPMLLVPFNDLDKPAEYQAVLFQWRFVIESGTSAGPAGLKHPRTDSEDEARRRDSSRSNSADSREGQDGGPPKEAVKYTRTEEELAVLDWLRDSYGDDPAVVQMQSHKATVGQRVLRLLRWAKALQKMRTPPRAGPSARPAGRGRLITQDLVGRFVKRTAQWVRDALVCRTLVEANRQNDAVRRTLRALHKNRDKLGMKKLRAHLEDALKRQAPAVHEEADEEFDMALSDDDDDTDEDDDDEDEDDDARELLGLRRSKTRPQLSKGKSKARVADDAARDRVRSWPPTDNEDDEASSRGSAEAGEYHGDDLDADGQTEDSEDEYDVHGAEEWEGFEVEH
ncbi:hypothetical protein L226DRAFT_524564 [Lentinus tigrinus ALCF2SS1-7]|uniref:Uncharacterized protein n=1 Tax=Lentinus tigrinus ALCF2SS1-6 TaxID=1328759 RepID=A0A5C2RVW1_9APHY|nr:hypothetical protein L227DRAFT_566500 [Lentinus tigrinus ALCF2SS1-6]RPD67930.1 hypothetical protein L226DRAFT_527567 [Lentinus tigrinus ALCF2SS1-7]RPD72496.1 hypothetical protein L226DRAFT_524564 [Lentinus tigrinus ALCF2SS1-7]